jgi:hypothetical protein
MPAVGGYSIRDYGNRVGHTRQMTLLDKYHIRGSISLSAAVCDHHPEIITSCAERDWEFFSHGIYNTRYTYGLSEAQEREMIEDAFFHNRKTHRQGSSRLLGSGTLTF